MRNGMLKKFGLFGCICGGFFSWAGWIYSKFCTLMLVFEIYL